MSHREHAIHFQIYQLLCDLKLMLLEVGGREIEQEVHASVLRLLVAMEKYCLFFKLTRICQITQDMENRWRSVHPGEAKGDVVDNLLRSANGLTSQLAPLISGSEYIKFE